MAGNGQLAIVTGASTGIGFELAHIAAEQGYDLLVVADEPLINNAADDFRRHGTDVQSVEADLSTFEGNDKLLEAVKASTDTGVRVRIEYIPLVGLVLIKKKYIPLCDRKLVSTHA